MNCGIRRVPKGVHDSVPYNFTGVLYLNHCTTVLISDVTISANVDASGFVAIDVFGTNIVDVTISTSCHCPNSTSMVNGIEFYHNDFSSNNMEGIMNFSTKATIKHYRYENNGLCNSSFALFLILIQESYGISMIVQNTNFTQLHNASVLYYYEESFWQHIENNITFFHCSINSNIGNMFTNMFHVLIHNDGYVISRDKQQKNCDLQWNVVGFSNCHFVNNSHMNSLLYFDLKNTLLFNAFIYIQHCNFLSNINAQILMVDSEVKVITQWSHFVFMKETNMSSNRHDNLVNMISSTNGRIHVSNVVITNNTYEHILTLYLSVLIYENYFECSSNFARFVIKAKEVSYYILTEHSTVNITKNLVYATITTQTVYTQHLKELCIYQFTSSRGNLDEELTENKSLNYKLYWVNNTYTAPPYEVNFYSYQKCSWLPGTAFYSSESHEVFSEVVETNILWANRTVRESALSMVCPCSDTNSYNCKKRHLGSLFPGQTLKVKLIMPQDHKGPYSMVAETKIVEHGCKITDVLEIVQRHESHGCNEYNYTIWSEDDNCELYLGPDDFPEVFYVTLDPCPLGFIRQPGLKSCHCDSVLKSFTTSCNLQDQTVLRPPKSWISGRGSNRSHVYSLSHNCPFDYCLLHESYVNPSTPDQQCQFLRSGMLCGHCQPGLSVVFGSSRCKQCSNMGLLIVIPTAIAGVVLVVMLFGFNLTVTNGAINTFIFYVNIISINFSVFFPKCHSACVLLALSNLDLGLETCFYNGMDGFSKMCLQLAFPLYLVLIACALIIGSRYSNRLQRLTAQRALQVLATLFLLVYTKILLTVCSVLFFFSPITHLPSGHISFVWSVDSTVPVFGIKFSILFAVCLVLFLILLPLNILLLFPRTLSRFRLINTFKPLIDAYLGPHKDGFAHWMGVQLLMRAIFLGLSALDRDVTLTIGAVLLGIMLCIEASLYPYKSKFKNIQESVMLLNLLVVYITASHYDNSSKNGALLVQCLIFTTLVYIIAYIAIHCVMSTCDKMIKPKMNMILIHIGIWKKQLTNDTSAEMMNMVDSEKQECSNYEKFQEPLIALDE